MALGSPSTGHYFPWSGVGELAQQAARDARSVVDGARIDCDVTIARLIGYTRRDNLLLEVACKHAAGFIIDTSTTSPRVFDCRVLAVGAYAERAAPANQSSASSSLRHQKGRPVRPLGPASQGPIPRFPQI